MSRANVVALSLTAVLMLAAPRPTPTPWLVWNASDSVPIGLYLIGSQRPRRGDLALVRLLPRLAELAQQRRYLTATAFIIKPVAAVAGDRVCRIGLHIVVRGRYAATAMRQDTTGRLIPAWHGCRRLAGGEAFLLSDVPGSFDSRYFGPFTAAQIDGRAVPLWLRSAGERGTIVKP